MRLSENTRLSLQAFLAGVKADTGIKFNAVDIWNHESEEELDPADYKQFEARELGSDHQLKGEAYTGGVKIEAYKYFTPKTK